VELEHRAASPVGARVRVTASASYVDGRLHRFSVLAEQLGADDAARAVATADITRVVVPVEKFLSRLS
jgi:predicted thioesterase